MTTVEGLANGGALSALQAAFLRHGAAQCGICTPGHADGGADDLLRRRPKPTEAEAMDALGGVLCRCTGYRKIVEAMLDVSGAGSSAPSPRRAQPSARACRRSTASASSTGEEIYGADDAPEDALLLRAVRSPHARARFSLGDHAALHDKYPGLVECLPRATCRAATPSASIAPGKDQPVLAAGEVRYRGEAIAGARRRPQALDAIRDAEVPIAWEPLVPVLGIEAALAPGAALVQADKPGNVLVRGLVRKGDVEAGFAEVDFVAEGTWRTSFVEHAYIEPEAGWAQRDGDRLTVAVTTQTPYMDRDEIAHVLGIENDQVRVHPDRVRRRLRRQARRIGAAAARHRGLEARPPGALHVHAAGSMAATTKRHPARMRARAACRKDGTLTAFEFHGDFDTGAYASWGPTVASRVPIHAAGPYAVPNVRNTQPAPCTPMRRRPERSVASACRNARSPMRRSTTSWPRNAASTRSSSGCATRCARATRRQPAR